MGGSSGVVVEGFAVPDKAPLKSPPLRSALDDLVSALEAGDLSEEEAAASAPVSRGRSVGVTVHVDGGVDGVVALLAGNDVAPRHVGSDFVEAFVPVRLLREVSDIGGVLFVEPIVPPEAPQAPVQRVLGEGPGVHGSEAWNDAGFTGAGVKVGVIDVGFVGFAELMGTELPLEVQARCYGTRTDQSGGLEACNQDGSHGTAVAESIIDIAPDAELYIAMPLSRGDLAAITDWMITEGVSVINMSLGWPFDGPGDGTSPSSVSPLRTVDNAVGDGVVWVNSAGNSALSSWFGTPADSDGDKTLEFDGREQLALNGGTWVQLRWDGAWGGETLDLDLYLYNNDGEVLERSLNPQLGGSGHNAYERFRAPGTGQTLLQVATRNDNGRQPAWIQIMAWSGHIEGANAQASITNPAESLNDGMLAAGAAHWNRPDTIESYSSRGPAPAGAAKPDIVGADCGQTVTWAPFCGTSQASPHIAGLAALVRQRHPDLTPQQVVAYLKENADRSDNPDNTWGHGLAALPQDISPDRAALEALYWATDGDNWTNNTNWLTDQPLDQWHGVTTNPDGRVTILDLPDNQLNGTLPPELGDLTELEALALYNNQLTGRTPPQLGNLTNLTYLDLEINQLSGDIPPELGNLTNLDTLWLNNNQLTGEIPQELGVLTNLETLYLSSNQLSGCIPAALQSVPTNDFGLLGLPWCSLPVDDRAALEALYYATDGDNWADNTNWLSDEPLDQWHGVTTGADGRVTELLLGNNGLAGAIPPELGSLTRLQDLHLDVNQLSGAIPAELGRLTDLESLGLGANRLGGSIPTHLGGITNLRMLELRDNQLSGSIPAALGSLSRLELLWLQENQLSGAVPAELGSLTNLDGMWLSRNEGLSGPLPGSFTELGVLRTLDLRSTHLCAPTDDTFQAWLRGVGGSFGVTDCAQPTDDRAALEALYYATGGPDWDENTNWLSDTPLDQWYGVTAEGSQVTALDLRANRLSGDLPAELGDLAGLEVLEMWGNQIFGTIPSSLGNLDRLRLLDLGSNFLYGPIPQELGALGDTLRAWYLSGDSHDLEGCVPAALRNVQDNDFHLLELSFCS